MKLFAQIFAVVLFSTFCFSQIPTNIAVQIVKAEDERRFDKKMEALTLHSNTDVRKRATLAIGRIGDERGIDALMPLLNNDSDEIRSMAAFAIGEIESIKGADAILKTLAIANIGGEIRNRAIEAAGKIAAANAKDEKSKLLGDAILKALIFEDSRRSKPNTNAILIGLTAILRAKPADANSIVEKFLDYSDARIRQNALNTLARLRTKNASLTATALKLLKTDEDAIVRANACRILAVSEDNSAVSPLINAALNEKDSRVRVSAIRALGNFKDKEIGETLINRGNVLLKNFKDNKMELLEIATVLGKFFQDSKNEIAYNVVNKIGDSEKFVSSEATVALAKIDPEKFLNAELPLPLDIDLKRKKATLNWRAMSSIQQGLGELANSKNESIKKQAESVIRETFNFEKMPAKDADVSSFPMIIPDLLGVYSQFKPNGFAEFLHKYLKHEDIQVRAAAAGLLADLPVNKANFDALNSAFDDAFLRDKDSNDAMLAIMDALFKVNSKDALPVIFLAFSSDDYLVRKKAFEIFKKDNSEYAKAMVERATSQKKDQVLPYKKGSKQGVILNSNADYLRAVSRKNGSVKAVFTTEKGTFTINLMPEEAPLTVDNFIKLAKSNYFNGLTVHRVVPNFVMQDGDPRGDGNGGPGWSIRCEVNMLEYERGAVGMALSGKDTGGSQWFVTHSPQPHLDGGYTVFGKVNENDMKIVDKISRGDKILKVVIIEKRRFI